jgi:hypothetical protein
MNSGGIEKRQEHYLMPKTPEFTTEEELADWVDHNDTAPFIGEMEDVEETFVVKKTRFETRLPDIRICPDCSGE